MVQLDQQLISYARRLFHDAELHYVQVLIFAYKEAIRLHNEQSPGHQIYRMQSELRLRKYVLECQDEIIRQQTDAAVQRALEAQARFDSQAA